jgi:hypothetical protein
LFTKDGAFPIEKNTKSTEIKTLAPTQRIIQMFIDHKCTLRVVAQSMDKADSNCISIELIPSHSNEPRRENFIMKHELRLEVSGTAQSDPYFE